MNGRGIWKHAGEGYRVGAVRVRRCPPTSRRSEARGAPSTTPQVAPSIGKIDKVSPGRPSPFSGGGGIRRGGRVPPSEGFGCGARVRASARRGDPRAVARARRSLMRAPKTERTFSLKSATVGQSAWKTISTAECSGQLAGKSEGPIDVITGCSAGNAGGCMLAATATASRSSLFSSTCIDGFARRRASDVSRAPARVARSPRRRATMDANEDDSDSSSSQRWESPGYETLRLLVPELDSSRYHKGQAGKIGVVGDAPSTREPRTSQPCPR